MAFDAPISRGAAQVVLDVATDEAPPPDLSISEWVDEGHIILSARTGSPLAQNGNIPLTFEGVEYLREPTNRLHPDDPCTRMTAKGGAQSAKSSIGQLWVGWSIANKPAPFAIGLPSAGEIVKYDDAKLAPLIEESPELRRRVKPVSTKSSEGSSTKKKRLLSGATILLFNLASPKELQMISAGNIILEEVGNALTEVGKRGSPVKQARERQAAYSVIGSKEAMLSTPSELGTCDVTRAYDDGDQRCFYGECQQCFGFFHLTPEGFRKGERGGTPHHFVCPPEAGGCGGVLEASDMRAFRRAGVWLPTFSSGDQDNPAPGDFVTAEQMASLAAPGQFPHRGYRVSTRDCEGREPSYYIWQAMCGLISWSKIAGTIGDAKTPADLKALEQQVYGRAWDPSVEAMDWEDLHKVREEYEVAVVPSRAGVLTGFCDVQGSYLEWGVIGWGPGGEWWVVDRGIIEGDTAGPEVWRELDRITRTTYPHADGGELDVTWGVDTGFRTQKVYAFCRGRPNLYAMDGQPGWKKPAIGKPKAVKVIEDGRTKGRVKLWPTGTWELKALLAWSLKISVEAGYQVPMEGRGHWSRREDEAWCQQITAEGLAEEVDKRSSEIKRWWRKLRERNEWVDIWVGCRALAYSKGVGAPRRDGQGEACDWEALAARRRPSADPDLFAAASAKAVRTETGPDVPKPERRFFRNRS
ncbi:MAG: hypothetical protein DCF29_03840 [Alphaproteobacteria bacterium]|nr:MAG: hypothetical protein DCF29_03840 [Alphaproteobacteria bacterium]